MEGDNPPRYLEDAGNGMTKLQGKKRRRTTSLRQTLALLREDERLHVNLSTECSRVREKVVIHVMKWYSGHFSWANLWFHFTSCSFADPLWTWWIAKLLLLPIEKKATAMLLLSRDSNVTSVCLSFIADRLTAIVNLPCRPKHLPFLYLWTGPGADSWVQNSPRAERHRCEDVGRTVDVTDYSKQNWFVFEYICSELGLWPEYTALTFCVANSVASHAVFSCPGPACMYACSPHSPVKRLRYNV